MRPGNYRYTIWAFVVGSTESCWLLGCWDLGPLKSSPNCVIQLVVPWVTASASFACQAMRATGIHLLSTDAIMRLANVSAQSQRNCDPHCIIAQLQPKRQNRDSVQPCARSILDAGEQSCLRFVIICGLAEQCRSYVLAACIVPAVLTRVHTVVRGQS